MTRNLKILLLFTTVAASPPRSVFSFRAPGR
jgi:hypothetical protein